MHTGKGGQIKLSVSNGNESCNKEMWKPTQKMLCTISLFEKMLVNPGNSGVPFCNLVFTRTTRVVACLSLSQVHLKRSGRNLKLPGSSSLHHTHTFPFMMVNTSSLSRLLTFSHLLPVEQNHAREQDRAYGQEGMYMVHQSTVHRGFVHTVFAMASKMLANKVVRPS